MVSFRLWLNEATGPMPNRLVDPALLTADEYYQVSNPKGKCHSSSAYDWDLQSMQRDYRTISHYEQLLFRRTVGGVPLEFRIHKEDRYKNQFVKVDKDGYPVHINGQLQYFTTEELQARGTKRWNHSLGVFHGKQMVGYTTDDEWGCLLVVVAREYRSLGLGTPLLKMALEIQPDIPSGGMTPNGQKAFIRAHREFVREYLQNGFYSDLVKQGKITVARVKEIVKSVGLPSEQVSKPEQNYNFSNPEDWVIFHNTTEFIMYDKKLKDIIDQEDPYWPEKAILGISFVGGSMVGDSGGYLRVTGGETDQIRKFMIKLALSWCQEEDIAVKIYDDDMPFVPLDELEDAGRGMFKFVGKPIDYKPFANHEKRWRRTFDKYDEFKNRMMELAFGKYQVT